MAIKDQQVKLPRLGKIRLGQKVKTGKGVEHPQSTDYFVVKTDNSTPEAHAEAFRQVYNDEPRELDVMFPTEDVDQFASLFYRYYARGGLICRGDGQEARARIDRTTGAFVDKDSKPDDVVLAEVPCNEECPKRKVGRCKPVLCLQFLLPNVQGLGVWQIDTSSFHGIRNIVSQVQLIKGLLGRISLLLLKLRLVPLTVQPAGQAKKTVHVLQLQTGFSMLDLQQRVLQLPQPAVPLAALDDSEQPSDLDEQAETFFKGQGNGETEPLPEDGPKVVEAEPLLNPTAGEAASAAAAQRQFANIGEMLTVCLNEFGIRAPEACEVLEIRSPPQFRGDLTAAYEKIAEYAQKKRG